MEDMIATMSLFFSSSAPTPEVPAKSIFATSVGRVAIQLVFPDYSVDDDQPWNTAMAKRGLKELNQRLIGVLNFDEVNPIQVVIERSEPWRHCMMRFTLGEMADAAEEILTPRSGPDFEVVFASTAKPFYVLEGGSATKAIDKCLRDAKAVGELKMIEHVYCVEGEAVFNYWIKRKKEKEGESDRGVRAYFLERLTDAVKNHVVTKRDGRWTGFDARYETEGFQVVFGMGKLSLGQATAKSNGGISELPS